MLESADQDIALTVCWHGLGLWLVCMRSANLPQAIGITSSDAETFMVEGLETLKSVGGSSIMTGKAHRFLQRILHLIKTMGKQATFPYTLDFFVIVVLY